MLGPTSTCAINTAEGKQRLFIYLFYLLYLMVEYYKTVLLSLSILNVISVVVLLSVSRVAFNFVVIHLNYSYIFFNFLGPQ